MADIDLNQRLLTKAELADRLRCHVTTVDRQVRLGMPFIPFGGTRRFEWAEVMRFLKQKGKRHVWPKSGN